MKTVQILDKEFKVFVKAKKIDECIERMAKQMDQDFKYKDPIFLGILNGSFMFVSDLFKHLTIDCQISFLKLASYQGTTSSGSVKRLVGLNEDIKDTTVIILEDIIDTGVTRENSMRQLKGYEPAEIKVASLTYKPSAYTKDIPIDYVGFEIPNDFIVGYGLDYDGYGRNLKDLYVLNK